MKMDTVTPIDIVNATMIQPDCDTIPSYWGYIAAGIAVLFYGTMYAPVKQYETGDGIFYQWIMCNGTFFVGVIVQLIRDSPTFYPIVMVGGVVFVTGNMCVVPIIKTIGLSIGMCIWGVFNLLSGWATGRFGLFGVVAEVPDNLPLNYVGVVLAALSAFVFATIKSNVHPMEILVEIDENTPLQNKAVTIKKDLSRVTCEAGDDDHFRSTDLASFLSESNSINDTKDALSESFVDQLSSAKKKILGISLSVGSGLLYGQTFTPEIYEQGIPGHSSNALDYVFATFTGIYITSTFYFAMYCIIKRSKPHIYPKVIVPGLISGVMWGVATSCWFVTNKALSEPVAFPIMTTLPAVLASCVATFIFKEIKGRTNMLKLLLGFVIAATGAILSALSKTVHSSC